MTSTTFFSGSSSAPAFTAQRFAPAAAPLNKAPLAVKAARSAVSASTAYPWMTRTLLARMSPRARRLLRADY